jgi:NADP-dependent 3-hydroxy acid dehydrogenase YdfG
MSGVSTDPVWLVTGCSTGFGREICKAVLARGWRVVATARDSASIADIVASAPDRAIAVSLDVQKPNQIASVVSAALEQFGGVDVLVNNAGYGYQSSVEEGEDHQIRDLFETNFFGLVRMTQAILPLLRAQRSGHIFNIGSISGVIGTPTAGFYSASKHAVEGFSEALASEVESLGIAVTVIEPALSEPTLGDVLFMSLRRKLKIMCRFWVGTWLR